MARILSTQGRTLVTGDGREVTDEGYGLCQICGAVPARGLFSGRREEVYDKKTPPYRGYLCDHCAQTFYRGRFVGLSKEYRGTDWKLQRRRARKRDNWTCRCCGKTREELKKRPDVHHIIPYRLSLSNDLNNLVCLCPVCHALADAAWRKFEENLRGAAPKPDCFYCGDGEVGYRIKEEI